MTPGRWEALHKAEMTFRLFPNDASLSTQVSLSLVSPIVPRLISAGDKWPIVHLAVKWDSCHISASTIANITLSRHQVAELGRDAQRMIITTDSSPPEPRALSLSAL